MNPKTMKLDPNIKYFTNATLKGWNSAAKNVYDSFKVNALAFVPDSKFVVASLDRFGAIIYHTRQNKIIYKLNLTDCISGYKFQEDKIFDEELRVWEVAVHYPNHVYVFTNRGFVVYQFSIDLTNEHEILSDPIKYTPIVKRFHRYPYFV